MSRFSPPQITEEFWGRINATWNLRELKESADLVRAWTERRDELIRAAHAEGHSLRAIAAAVGLSHGTVDNIVKR